MSPIAHYRDSAAEVRKACVGSWENNVYVVVCRATGSSVIVDAAAESDTIARLAAGTEPGAILTTHGHVDHVGAARETADRFAIPILLHPADADLAPLSADGAVGADPIAVGELRLLPIHTPGHTAGSTCFTVGDVLLTGDTLFPGGPGATRGPGADRDQIMGSIRRLLDEFDDATLVLPGHGLDTTIGAERPHVGEWAAGGAG